MTAVDSWMIQLSINISDVCSIGVLLSYVVRKTYCLSINPYIDYHKHIWISNLQLIWMRITWCRTNICIPQCFGLILIQLDSQMSHHCDTVMRNLAQMWLEILILIGDSFHHDKYMYNVHCDQMCDASHVG